MPQIRMIYRVDRLGIVSSEASRVPVARNVAFLLDIYVLSIQFTYMVHLRIPIHMQHHPRSRF